jgi:hypothetical protein
MAEHMCLIACDILIYVNIVYIVNIIGLDSHIVLQEKSES